MLNFSFGGKQKFLRKNVEKKGKERNTKQCHLNITKIKATKFGMALFNGTYL